MASLLGNARNEEQAKQAKEEEQQQDASGEKPLPQVENQAAAAPSPSHSQPSDAESQAQGFTNATTDSRVPLFENTHYPWMFDSFGMRWSPEFAPWAGGRPDQAGGFPPMVPILCPSPFPGYLQGHLEEQRLRSGGIFAVPMVPVVGPVAGYPPSGLIPVSYNLPQRMPIPGNGTAPAASQPSERAMPAPAQEGPGAGPHVPPPAAAQVGQAQRPEGQRQIVRRFHVAFQIDLLLILKLAVMVFIFNQDGSRDRLFLLLFLAGLIYLYQIGALTPLLRWISQSAQRAMMPPQQLQPVHAVPADVQVRDIVQGENAAANAPAPGAAAAAAANDHTVPPAAGGGGVAGDTGGDEVRQRAPPQGPTWWGFIKEVQMLVVGFVTSLLPGFHQHMD